MEHNDFGLTPDLLDAYLSGTMTPDEQKRIYAYAAAHPAAHAALATLASERVTPDRALVTPLTPLLHDIHRHLGLDDIGGSTGLRVGTRTPIVRRSVPHRMSGRRTWIGQIGGRIGTLATVGLASIVVLTAVMGLRHTLLRGGTAPKVYATHPGERASFALDDGTRVTLAPASTLQVQDRGHDRVAVLRGEAFFAVAHHEAQPFTVLANDVRTTVLGTEFGVRAYDERGPIRVVVRAGRVAVGGTIVNANDAAQATLQNISLAHDVDVNALLAFADGTLQIDGQTLATAIPDLNRWYDADIRVDDPVLRQTHFKATFAAGSRTDLAAILELTFNARARRAGRVIVLTRR